MEIKIAQIYGRESRVRCVIYDDAFAGCLQFPKLEPRVKVNILAYLHAFLLVAASPFCCKRRRTVLPCLTIACINGRR